jgi:probable rRNA maturation factor
VPPGGERLDLSDVPAELRGAAAVALRSAGIAEGHLAVALVPATRIRELNREHRGLDEPTDVLSFPIDDTGHVAGPRELGDVFVCPEHAADLHEATIHGILHLCGYDHETDRGEMMRLQAEAVRSLGASGQAAGSGMA